MPNGNDKKNGNGAMGANGKNMQSNRRGRGHGLTCDCGVCGGGGRWHGFYLLRVLLTIIILMLVFMAGVRFGELKALMMGGRGYMMYNHGYMPAKPYMTVPSGTSTPVASPETAPIQ
jgi:hypothetical protein